jgi:DNA-binding NarL/FixJ family response regulator
MAIRIFIYDDNQDRRDSLKALISLSDEMKYVGDAADCTNVLEEIEEYDPDVVLMDINMPNVDGIEGLQKIKRAYPDVKVLMQTAFDDSDKIFTSIRHGASGYVLKKDNPQRLLQAIHEVFEGGAVMNPAIAQKVLDFFKPEFKKSPLSNKENEVLALLAEGLSYKMVADRLSVSYTTINTHTKHIYEKLHVASLGEAIAYYYKNLQ